MEQLPQARRVFGRAVRRGQKRDQALAGCGRRVGRKNSAENQITVSNFLWLYIERCVKISDYG